MDSKNEDSSVDYKTIKDRVSMKMILSRYSLLDDLRKSGKNLIGRCPIHKGSNNHQFSVDPEKNIFNCFAKSCDGCGNVLDFVALMESGNRETESIKEAALKIQEWFPDESGFGEEGNKNQAVLKKMLDGLVEKYEIKDDIELTIAGLKLLSLELEKWEVMISVQQKVQ